MSVPAPVIIVDYDPAWPERFTLLKETIDAALGNLPHSVEHIGSTSVPGLAAKPIIDLEIVVDEQHVKKAMELMATIGYAHDGDGGIPGRERLRPPAGLPAHHPYVCAKDNLAHQKHLIFRDYLRAHPEAAAEYGALKKRLAAEYGNNRQGYTDAKTEFVTGILHKAVPLR